MGAGKTTVGRELAARLDVPFFDLDDFVEAAEKCSIKDIFAQHGKPYFRKRERDLLRITSPGTRTLTFRPSAALTARCRRRCAPAPSVAAINPASPVTCASSIPRTRRATCRRPPSTTTEGRAQSSRAVGSRPRRIRLVFGKRRVISQHPRSAYYPYALLLGNPLSGLPFDLARDAAEKFADSPAYPYLLLAAGVTAQGEAEKRAIAHAPVVEVLRYLQFANDFYDATLRAGDPAVYEHAGGNLRTVQNELERLSHAERKRP